MNFTEQIKADFNLYMAQATDDDFSRLRQDAYSVFEKLGIPSIQLEEWKYSNLRPIQQGQFTTSCVSKLDAESLINAGILNKIVANKLVFVNGCLFPDLSVWLETNEQIIVCNLATARKEHTSLFNAHFGKYIDYSKDGLLALNTALLSDGAFVYVPEGVSLQYPLMITNITDATEHNLFQQPRNLIVVDKNASVSIIENYLAVGSYPSFTNVVNEIFVSENASLEHYKVQRAAGDTYQTNFTQLHQLANTNINQVTLTLDGNWVRNNLHFFMNGQHCNSLLYGLYIPDGNQFVDNHSRVDHAMPNCYSDEKYKGVLKDHATAVFNGKIVVHENAQKTNAYQRNQNILLSNTATINTKPQLEIFADDVKCTHGATIGQLDEEPMFYLRSRGISEQEARRLLLNAFADDIAEKIKIPELVSILESEIERKL